MQAARQRHPGIPFHQADFRTLPIRDATWAGIVGLYCMIHLPPPDLQPTLKEWARVLKPGGLLLLAVHLGSEVRHLTDWWGQPVDIDFHFFEPAALSTAVAAAGFRIEEHLERDPYPGVEAPTRRLYLLATRAAPPT